MKKVLYLIMLPVLLLSMNRSFSQANVLDPADPDVVFTTANRPAAPAFGNSNIIKWGHTSRLSWNPYSKGYRSYIYQRMPFRLKYPKTYQHNVADGKKYPLFIFFHGLGEKGDIYDNEYQLLHGGETHAQNVDNGNFDGFLFYAQSESGNSQDYEARISNLIDSLVKYVKVDIDRVIVSGLSSGGSAAWDFVSNNSYGKKVSADIPISAASLVFTSSFPNFITVPMWMANGGQDASPAPYTVDQVIKSYKDLGGKMDHTFFPDLGHGVWDNFWATPGYFQYLSAQNKTNPLVYFQRNEFCPSDAVNAKLGLYPGFYAYQWDKNGVVISGATSNTFTVTQYGTYRGRYKRTSTSAWSDWSPIPAVISQKQATVTPPIQTNGLFSSVLPSLDGKTTVPLMVPDNYAAYEWRRISDNALVGSTNKFDAPVGQYKVMVTEQFGCSSSFSSPYSVIAANGSNLPDNITNLSAVASSSSSIRLDWNDNPTPTNNETAFEIFRSTTPGSGYSLIKKGEPDVLNFSDSNLLANTKYYYRIRPINLNGAGAVSSEIGVSTTKDVKAPTAPTNLIVTSTSRSSISLSWDEASDDVGVYKYDVYIDGVKAFITENTFITLSGLTALQTYGFYVIARDLTGNLSPASNHVSASAALNGLNYKYYQGSWSVLPDFNSLTPVKTGTTPNVDISVATQNEQFGILWEGSIKIPVTGSYTFETSSDDGSKLYIGSYGYGSTPLVNNDGLHGTQSATGTISLNAGTYPIAITFFQQGGGKVMNVYWKSTAAGISRQIIPNSAFADVVNIPPSSLPAKPSNLLVNATAYNKINLSWNDNSNNETGFEITRSTSLLGAYVNIGTTGANVTSFIDSVNLSPSTKYWYKVRSVNQYGESDFVSILQGSWGFNGNYNDGSGNNRNMSAGNNPSFNAGDKKEGTHSLSLNGSNQYADMTFSASRRFPSDGCTTRSIALWIKPNASSISGSNKIIFDFGGSDNGIALRFNSGSLQAGIASSNSRTTAIVNSVTSNSKWVSNGWNHISVVYNVNVLQLFLNGSLMASTNLSFSSVGSSTNSSRIGATYSSNAFGSSTSSTYCAGLIDDIVILNEPVSGAGILAIMNQSYGADTTFAAPSPPNAPSQLVSTAQTAATISLSFKDNSSDESSFEIYRSVTTGNNFRLLTSIAGSSGANRSFIDSNLFSNTNYFYKVRAVGEGGTSAFTTDLSVVTANNIPVFSPVSNFSMRYDTQKDLTISATDVDAGTLGLSFVNPLPAFASFTNTSNGNGILHLNPSVSDQGVYPISILVTDANQGTNTLAFTLTVNDNYVPVIQQITNNPVAEGSNSSIGLAANKQGGNSTLIWTLDAAPAFVTLTDAGNGIATLGVIPGYADAGTYTVTVKCIDGVGGEVSESFNLVVTDATPSSEKVYISMKYYSANAPAPWNNINSTNTSGLLNSNGAATPVGIEFLGTSWNAGDAGAVTGNNSGVYPDAAIKDYFWFGAYGAPENVNVNLKGLSASAKYNVSIFGSSAWTGLGNNGTTNYTINGVVKPLYVDNNQQNTVTFNSLTPDANGMITLNLSKGAGAPYGMVNAIVLEKQFDDGTAPVIPKNLVAEALANGTVGLSWNDVAYNENNYLVYRSATVGGPFTVINPDASNANDSTYNDGAVSSGTTYFYKIEATNNYGSSGMTGVVSVVTGNKPPVLLPISDVIVKTGSTSLVNILGSDGPGETLTPSISGLPAFASFVLTGNGTGTLIFSPGANDIGVYKNIVVTITDNLGSTTSDTFNVSVLDGSLRSVYVNFGTPGGAAQPTPWNNFMFYPSANSSIGSLLDDANGNSGFSVTLQQAWQSNWSLGMITGDNSGMFPDNVLQTSIVSPVSNSLGLQIGGLNPSKKYNLVFLSNLNSGPSQKATFSSGGKTVTQEARYNTNVSVQLNGLTANSAGTLVVTAQKDAAASYINLNAMVIQEYDPGTPLLRPFYLFAESIVDRKVVNLTWSDQSDNESGFEIFRSTSLQGMYTLVTTTAANVTAYSDNGVSANVRYYYKVRAAIGAQKSDYSNIASLVLPLKTVSVNLNSNAAQNMAAPWNNTTGPSTAGSTFANLVDNNSVPSGIDMVITKEFNAPGYTGVTSQGIFPGSVMQSNYWTDAGMVSEVKFTNLDIRKKYRIGCFGSAIHSSFSIAVYSSNGKSVQLNSVYNDSKIVYLKDLSPVDGELTVSVSTLTGNPYSFTSAFTIESYDDPMPFQPALLNDLDNNLMAPPLMATISDPDADVMKNIASATGTTTPNAGLQKLGISVYPNPFIGNVNVDFSSEKVSDVEVMLFDLNSRLIYKTGPRTQPAGRSKISVDIPSATQLPPGAYIISVLVDGKMTNSVKLIKVR